MKLDDLVVGYEFEFTSPHGSDELRNLLKRDLRIPFIGKKDKRWRLVWDGSIQSKHVADQTHELVSPPKPYMESITILHDVLDWMKRNNCHTNATTGFHVNISHSIVDLNKQIDVLKLVLCIPEYSMLKQFKRQRNGYCKALIFDLQNWARNMQIKETQDWNDLADKLYDKLYGQNDKYHTVNVSKLLKDNYVEFRLMGNRNYHLRFVEIKQNIDILGRALLASMDADTLVSDYHCIVMSLFENKRKSHVDNVLNRSFVSTQPSCC